MQRQSRVFASAIMLVLFGALAVMPASRAVADENQDGGIVGSWIGTLSLTGTPFSFTELGNINLDGTITGVNGISHFCQNPSVPSSSPLAVELSGYFGSWVQLGDANQIAVTLKRLLFACDTNTPAIYGPSFRGQHIGFADIQAVGTLQHTKSGDNLTGPITFQLTDFNGQKVFAGSGTVSFSRVAIEPLSADDPPLDGIGIDPNTNQCRLIGANCTKNTECCGGFCNGGGSFGGKGGGKPGVCS